MDGSSSGGIRTQDFNPMFNFLFFRLLSSFACRTKACMHKWNKWILKTGKSNDFFFLEMFLKKIFHLL